MKTHDWVYMVLLYYAVQPIQEEYAERPTPSAPHCKNLY